MTISEAIKLIEELKNSEAYGEMYGRASNEPMNMAIDMAEEALMKREQRVPDSEISEIGGIQHTCPSCCGFVGYLNDDCENCGQKLNWEE